MPAESSERPSIVYEPVVALNSSVAATSRAIAISLPGL